jgi:hypothetical protein
VSGADPALVREVLRDVLSELLPDLVADARGASRSTPTGATPSMPPVPVAAVHRPSGWRSDDPDGAHGEGRVEEVSLTSDAELDAFVQRLLRRSESPQERAALRSGAVRFTLRGGGAPGGGGSARHIEHGAVTERLVRETAAAGGSLVLGPKAVLTPLARDVARTLGVTIEKEKRC